ncbi:hypothetical protein CIU55_22710 (plasmid) [Salmonella enterica]|nr:hypothetical protein [Salmonella enterica]HAC6493026.1 hypothetical protein [Salmonella enterica subsp. houtenae serovar 44:z36[z38]:-]EBF1293931.1 hypothetical protein [Salmonella enterica]EBT1403685.1 hypothetical protein [Salmonella enterica]ELC1763804.1 hypothetical protein [Salmonella enterica]
MKPHFDPELDAPVPLDDEALQADEPITPSARPAKRPLWDQPKVQIAALAVFAVLGLTWKMSGSSTPPDRPATVHGNGAGKYARAGDGGFARPG